MCETTKVIRRKPLLLGNSVVLDTSKELLGLGVGRETVL
jgi:hypothetical protein